MKVAVSETITKQVDVELPLYGCWWDEVADGRAMFDTNFRIGADLKMVSVTEWSGDTIKTEIELHQLNADEVGNYLRHTNGCQPEKFWAAFGNALGSFIRAPEGYAFEAAGEELRLVPISPTISEATA